MAAARKHQVHEAAAAKPAKAGPALRSVAGDERHADAHNPIADHLLRLEEAFSSEADVGPRYPGKVRIAILVAAPAALWALIGLAAIGARALF